VTLPAPIYLLRQSRRSIAAHPDSADRARSPRFASRADSL
jgi:hypothetical protein